MREISIPIVEALPNLRNTFDAIHCVAAERGRLITEEKDSSWVKLKAFPTNVGRPRLSNSQQKYYTSRVFCWSRLGVWFVACVE